jgi:hypothetical protein
MIRLLRLFAYCCFSLTVSGQVSNEAPSRESGFEFNNQKLDGLWTMDVVGKSHSLKHFFLGRYGVCHMDPSTNLIKTGVFGFFKQSPTVLNEKVKFTTAGLEHLRGKGVSLQLGFAGDDLFSQFSKVHGKEVWSRTSTERDARTLDGVVDFSSERSELDGYWYRSWPGGANVKVMDRGRFFAYHFDNRTSGLYWITVGIYSIDKSGVLREKVLYATEESKALIGAVRLFRANFSGSPSPVFFQKDTQGMTLNWKRWGPAPPRDAK